MDLINQWKSLDEDQIKHWFKLAILAIVMEPSPLMWLMGFTCYLRIECGGGGGDIRKFK